MFRFLRIFFDYLYHSFAWSYDFVSWIVSGGRWKNWVQSVMPLVAGQEILELGCGTGMLQTALLESGYRATAIDESSQMLRIANKKLVKEFPDRNLRLIRAHADRIPTPAEVYDSVVATFPSEYITQVETIMECRRVLKPQGRLIILLGVSVQGGGVYNLFLRFLYYITGQRTPARPILQKAVDGMKSYGFQAQIETMYYQQDQLTVIVAE